jgi:hypothetical protein
MFEPIYDEAGHEISAEEYAVLLESHRRRQRAQLQQVLEESLLGRTDNLPFYY